MAELRVALLSTAMPNAKGSMSVYGELVRNALETHAPQLDVLPVGLCDAGPADGAWGRRLAQLRCIHAARQRASRVRAEVYHVLDASYGFMVAGIPLGHTLVTVHDLIPALQARGHFPVPRPGWAARRLIAASLRVIERAGAVCADSRATADDVRRLTGRAVDAVIPLICRDLPMEGEAPVGSTRNHTLLLHLGNNGFYKNRGGVIDIFALMARERSDLHLIMAGAAPDAALRSRIAGQSLEGRVSFAVEPDDRQLVGLYRQAALLLFPSLYEGFGWPPLEAMRYGCPVVCSWAGSLPEVVGDAALLSDPNDVRGFAATALRVLSEPQLAAHLIERGHRNIKRFDARRMAQGLCGLYQQLANSASGSLARREGPGRG